MDKLKSSDITGAIPVEPAVALNIFPEIPSGPEVVSKVIKKLKTSSSCSAEDSL